MTQEERIDYIKRIFHEDCGVFAKDIAKACNTQEHIIYEDLTIIFKTTRSDPAWKAFFDERIIHLIAKVSYTSITKCAKELGCNFSTVKRYMQHLESRNRLPSVFFNQDYAQIENFFRDYDLEGTKTILTQKELEQHMLRKRLQQTLPPQSEDTSTHPSSSVHTDAIPEDKVFDTLYMHLEDALQHHKMTPKNFSEAKQLLELILRYKEDEMKRMRDEQKKDPFRQYQEEDVTTLFQWIEDAIDVLDYITHGSKEHAKQAKHIREQLSQLHRAEAPVLVRETTEVALPSADG